MIETKRLRKYVEKVLSSESLPLDFENFDFQLRTRYQGRPIEFFMEIENSLIPKRAFLIGEIGVIAHAFLQGALDLFIAQSTKARINLMDVKEIDNYFRDDNKVSIFETEGEKIELQAIIEALSQNLNHHLMSQSMPSEQMKGRKFFDATNSKKIETVQRLLNGEIRQKILLDGGDVKLDGIFKDKVLIRLVGRCQNCESGKEQTISFIKEELKRSLETPDLSIEIE